MGRPPASKNHEPRRVESQARMTVADEPVIEAPPIMDVVADPAVPEDTIEFQHPDGGVDGIENLGRPYYPMGDAPQDGTMIEAHDAQGREFRMIWRRTSRYNAKMAHWEYTGFWSDPFSRTKLEVEPVGWRMQEGFMMPGMLVT